MESKEEFTELMNEVIAELTAGTFDCDTKNVIRLLMKANLLGYAEGNESFNMYLNQFRGDHEL